MAWYDRHEYMYLADSVLAVCPRGLGWNGRHFLNEFCVFGGALENGEEWCR
jgi:hypothetical protein